MICYHQKNNLLAFCLLLLPFYFAMAQQRLSGIVIDTETNKGLEFSTVSLHQNGQLVNGGITNTKGEFTLTAPKGSYLFRAEFLSFTTYETQIDLQGNTKLPPIALSLAIATLEEVELTAEKRSLALSLDKKVFNVDKELIASNGTLSQVLDNVPAVSVDLNGAVALRGNPNVTLLVNGKPSALVANNGIEQIPASSIARVEVITNPSANMQAQGTAGIINIVLKKNNIDGLNGAITATTGTPANHSINLSLNYHKRKWNLFSRFGWGELTFNGAQTVSQQSSANNLAFGLNQAAKQQRNYKGQNMYVGAEFEIDTSQSITTAFYHRNNTLRNQTRSTYNYLATNQNLDSTLVRNETYKEPQQYSQWEANYTKHFKKEGQQLSLNLQYDFWNDDENEQFFTRRIFPDQTNATNLRTNDIESSDDFLLQTDFKTPLGKTGRLETGFRGETRVISSNYRAETLVNNQWQTFMGIANSVDYHETIGGAYAQYGNQWGKLKYQLGLRTEYTKIKIEDQQDAFADTKSYTRLFPSAHITYAFKATTEFKMGYSSRINRPSFWQLNPFGGLSDIAEIRLGNPDLDPAFTDAVELSFLQRFGKLSLNPAIYYQQTENNFSTFNFSDPNGVIRYLPINLDYEKRLGAEIAITYRPTKWLGLSGEFNWYSFTQKGNYQGTTLNAENSSWFSRLNSRLKLPTHFSFQASFNYRAQNQNAQTLTKAIHYLNLGLSKSFWNNTATLAINADNVLDSRIRQTITVTNSFKRNNSRTPFGDRYSVSFTYRFNQKKNQKTRGPRASNRQ